MPVGVLVVLVGLGAAAVDIGHRALAAKADLEAAIPLAGTVETQVLAHQTPQAEAAAQQMRQHTAAAAKATDSVVWKSFEWVPVIGANLHAVRVASDAANELTQSVVVPVSRIDISTLQSSDGRVDLQALASLKTTIDGAANGLAVAQADLKGVDQKSLIPQVSAGIDKLNAEVSGSSSVMQTAKTAVGILPDALGAQGAKNYLVLFQNNAETRGWGGNPAELMLLHVDDGKISITAQANSGSFTNGLATPIIPLDPSMEALYGSKIGRYEMDITTPADFPYTAKLAQAFWASVGGQPVDGVLSFDPVGLSYLLSATGPVTLPGGATLTSANAVPLLLNQVYFMFDSSKPKQDAYFAAAAMAVFDKLSSGKVDVKALTSALSKAVDEHRLLFTSNDPAVQKVILGTPLSGTLPTSNTKNNAVGVFFDDTTGAKMDYYFSPTIAVTSNQCTASAPTMHATVTLQSNAPANAGDLPMYVKGPYYNGKIAMDTVLYGPVGGAISDVEIDGKPYALTYSGQNLDRPAVKVSVVLSPGEKLTLTYTMTGKSGAYGPVQVLTTGLKTSTPTTIDSPGC